MITESRLVEEFPFVKRENENGVRPRWPRSLNKSVTVPEQNLKRRLTHGGFPSSKYTVSSKRYFEDIQVYDFIFAFLVMKNFHIRKKLSYLNSNKYQDYFPSFKDLYSYKIELEI